MVVYCTLVMVTPYPNPDILYKQIVYWYTYLKTLMSYQHKSKDSW